MVTNRVLEAQGMVHGVLSSLDIILLRKGEIVFFTLIVMCSVPLHRGALGWSTVCSQYGVSGHTHSLFYMFVYE